MGLRNPSRELKFSRANADKITFPVQLSTSRIGNLTRLIVTLAKCDYTPRINIERRFLSRRSNHLFGRLNASCYISSALVLEEGTDQNIHQQ